MLDQPLQVRLELVLVHAVRAALKVKLDFQQLGAVELPVDEPIELLLAVWAVHQLAT
jgi:hypothetical protein